MTLRPESSFQHLGDFGGWTLLLQTDRSNLFDKAACFLVCHRVHQQRWFYGDGERIYLDYAYPDVRPPKELRDTIRLTAQLLDL